MDNLEKIKRHLGKEIQIIIKGSEGEDTFMFKPLNIEQQAILMEISSKIQSREKIKVNGIEVPQVQREDMKEMFDLLFDVCKTSMPEVDDDSLKDFVNTNFNELSEKISDLIPKNINQSALDKIKKKQEERKLARESGN